MFADGISKQLLYTADLTNSDKCVPLVKYCPLQIDYYYYYYDCHPWLHLGQ